MADLSFKDIANEADKLSKLLIDSFSDKKGVIIRDVLAPDMCPKCKIGTLHKIEGKYGPFYGCSTYPECNYTKSINIWFI